MSAKICKICNKERSLDDFYPMRSRADGRDYYCKSCRIEKTRKYGLDGKNTAKSTVEVQNILSLHGIKSAKPKRGYRGYDLVALGQIPVEAKAAKPTHRSNNGGERFTIMFTKAQAEKYKNNAEGFVVFVAHCDDQARYFVIPATEPILKDMEGHYVCFTINDNNPGPTYERIRAYENAFYLITQQSS